MAFNGNGVYVRLYNWVNDAAANIKIRADRMDNEMDGFATGLSTCITKDGQTTITANLPMATWRHTGVGNAQSRTDYAAFGQVQDGKAAWAAAGGTADAITASYTIPITALVDGQLCYVRAGAANATTTPTFSPNGLTARTIVKAGGTALAVGDIAAAGQELILRYNLASTRWELLNPLPAIPAIPFSQANSSNAAFLDFAEDTDNGANVSRLIGNASLAADILVTLPPATGTLSTLAGTETLSNKTLTAPVLGVASATSINFGGGALSSYVLPTSFTPTVVGTTTAGAGTYTTQTGWYQRIGDVVYFSVNLTWTAHTGTGNLRIDGLPIASSANNGITQLSGNFQNIVLTAGNYGIAAITASSSSISLVQSPTGGGGNTAIAMDTAGTINVTGLYRV